MRKSISPRINLPLANLQLSEFFCYLQIQSLYQQNRRKKLKLYNFKNKNQRKKFTYPHKKNRSNEGQILQFFGLDYENNHNNVE